MLDALIFDVDGTMADTEAVHRYAFNQAFDQDGLGWHWDTATYRRLLNVSGGKERILHYWREVQPAFDNMFSDDILAKVARLHALKTTAYTSLVGCGGVTLRPGVLALITSARAAGLRLAIATTTSPANIDALLRSTIGVGWDRYFAVVEDASTAPNKKPHPQVFAQALARLGARASQCLAFEDSENGLRAAHACGVPTIVTPTQFTANQDFSSALACIPSLQNVSTAQLQAWHRSTTH